MSKEVQAPQTTDITVEDERRIQLYMASGAKGFDLTKEVEITKMMDLYLGGKTYSQISRITRSPKELVMMYSKQLNWFDLKNEYLGELQMNMRGRVIAAKMQSQDFLLQLTQMWQKKIGQKMDAYMQTGNPEHADSISLKEISKYLDTVKALQALTEDRIKGSDKPLVGLNVGDGVTMTKKDDGSVEITPKGKTIGLMLETLANKRREQEAVKRSDIKEVTPITEPKKEGDSGEEK